MKNNLLTNIYFLGQFLRSPATTGSICPSSRFLVHELVNMALEDNTKTGLIVDLGTGSGVVSQELLKRGVLPEQILAVDISSKYDKIFNKLCPNIKLCIGDARDLAQIIAANFPNTQIRAVISSLPLRNIPAKIVCEIMLGIWHTLRNGGVLIQFTYALWMHFALERYDFIHIKKHYVPLNLPPALVEKYIAKT